MNIRNIKRSLIVAIVFTLSLAFSIFGSEEPSVNYCQLSSYYSKLLLDTETDINLQDENGRMVLHCALSIGDLDMAKLFFEMSADLNIKDNRGITPLEAMKISKSYPLTYSNKKFDNLQFPLIDAIRKNDIVMVRLLIGLGAMDFSWEGGGRKTKFRLKQQFLMHMNGI